MRLGLLALLALPGCISSLDVARERAVQDLSCPSQRISVYVAADKSTIARGCGAWTQYECFGTRSRLVCVREAPAHVNAAPPEPEPEPEPEPALEPADQRSVAPADQHPRWN